MKRLTKLKKTAPLLVVGVLLLGILVGSNAFSAHKAGAAPTKAQADYFLKIDGIQGDSTDAQHAGEIALDSFSWSKDGAPGLEQTGTAGGGGGGGAGKVDVRDMFFSASTGKASPKLMLAVASGTHIKEAVLSVRKSGKNPQQFMTIKLSDVLISSYAAAGQGENTPTDQFSINFAKIEFSYTPQKADSSADTPVIGSWDFKSNTLF